MAQEAKTVENKQPKETEQRILLFLGASLTSGYGLKHASSSFPSQIQLRLNKIYGTKTEVINSSSPGKSTSDGINLLKPYKNIKLLGNPTEVRGLAESPNHPKSPFQTAKFGKYDQRKKHKSSLRYLFFIPFFIIIVWIIVESVQFFVAGGLG